MIKKLICWIFGHKHPLHEMRRIGEGAIRYKEFCCPRCLKVIYRQYPPVRWAGFGFVEELKNYRQR